VFRRIDELLPAIEGESGGGYMPTPQAVAVAILSLMAFGVIIGSVTSRFARSASTAPIVIEEPVAAEPETAPISRSSSPEPIEAPISAPIPLAEPAPLLSPAPEEPIPTEAPPTELPPELPPEPTLPPIEHVFLIVLGSVGYEEAFGETATPTGSYVGELESKGEMLANYYAVAGGELANEVALLSGQGPTVETAANCPTYAPIPPGTVGASEQIEGSGCLYPAETSTLPGQLEEAKMKWRFYLQGMQDTSGEAPTCRRPAPGSLDPNWGRAPGRSYRTWRNPAVYFESLSPKCEAQDVDLTRLETDLGKATGVPNLAYIAPDACHDGSAEPCEPGQAGGMAGAETFLREVIPKIEASPVYATSLIAIVPAQAPQAGPTADSSSCCATPEYPNLETAPETEPVPGPVKETGGGGRVGMLLLSPFVTPGAVNESGYFNHFSTLRSIEELFELEPIGYAAEPAVTPFDETVYSVEPSEGAGEDAP
jgi:hypothetical protein